MDNLNKLRMAAGIPIVSGSHYTKKIVESEEKKSDDDGIKSKYKELLAKYDAKSVADLSDDDKVIAVLPGGTSDRLFNKHRTDQIDSFINGDKLYWWFSDTEIKKHSEHELVLNPLKEEPSIASSFCLP